MILQNTQQSSITLEEIETVLQYFEKLGYKRQKDSIDKLIELAKDHPDKDFVQCAKEMYEWFSEAWRKGRRIKSFHLTFRNWVKKDYAPKRKIVNKEDFFQKEDLY